MSNYNSSVLNSTYTNSSSCPDIRGGSPVQCVAISVFVLSTITLIVGISSWILIKKFRHFKNYLFLSIIFNNVLNIALSYVADDMLESKSEVIILAYGLSFLYFKLSAHFWLLLLCYVFYIELVKVLGGEVKRKYLKSTLFAWGLPLFLVVFYVFVIPHIDSSKKTSTRMYHWALFFPLLINLLMYVKVLYALLKTDVRNSSDWCRRVQVATIIFLISNTLFLLLPLRIYVTFPNYLGVTLVLLQPAVVVLYFYMVRLNRTVWKKYYDRKFKNTLIPLRIKCQPK